MEEASRSCWFVLHPKLGRAANFVVLGGSCCSPVEARNHSVIRRGRTLAAINVCKTDVVIVPLAVDVNLADRKSVV